MQSVDFVLRAAAIAALLAMLLIWLRRQWRIHTHVPAARRGSRRERAPREYVAALFDSYSEDYDEHLLVELSYAGANLVSDALNRYRADGPLPLARALDLGCGTGLLGVLLRSRIGHLAGVDLSAAMLDAARARGIYDALHQGDLLHHLRAEQRARTAAWNLIAAADVLVYLGELDALMGLVARRLSGGGLFICTTEDPAADENAPRGYALLQTGRFGHRPDYVAAAGEAAGLEVVAQSACVLRTQRDAPVHGHIHCLERPR